MYPETTQGAYFAIDNNGYLLDKTCFMLITESAEYLQKTLSSSLFEYAYKNIFSSVELGNNGYQYNKHALIKLPIKKVDYNLLSINDKYQIDRIVYELYGLSDEEINYIENK